MTSPTSPHSQTLSRGIQALELLAEADVPLRIAQLAASLGVHRSIAYRILRTLEDHGLVTRDAAGGIQLGLRLAALARGVSHDLQAAALPELTALANELSMTAFVALLDRSECVTLVSVEPRHLNATVAQRPGTRHSLRFGAPGIAIQSRLTPDDWASRMPGESIRPEAREAQRTGYATSRGEVIPGLSSVAVPLEIPGQPPATLAVVYVDAHQSAETIAHRLKSAAASIEHAYAI